MLPVAVLHFCGSFVGHLVALIPNQLRSIAERNLALCFPELSRQEQRRLLRRSLAETGKTAFELGLLWCARKERYLSLVRRVEGEQDWLKAVNKGRGVIAFTPHVGAWELAFGYDLQNRSATVMYRPSRVGFFADQKIRDWREGRGAKLVPANAQGVRALIKALRNGEVIGILPDQNPAQGEGVFTPFFSQPAYTMTLLSSLALRYKAPVFAVYAKRLSWAKGYEIHYIPAPEIARAEDIESSVMALNQMIEHIVKSVPEQYLWAYKRFKTRPDGMEKIY